MNRAAPQLETPNLMLRLMTVADTDAYLDYINLPEYLRYMPFGVASREATALALKKEVEGSIDTANWTRLVMLDKAGNNTMVGDILIWPVSPSLPGLAQIGFGLHPDYWGKGYATEALRLVTPWAHEALGFHRLQANCHIDNIGSWRALDKAGYEREGIIRYGVYNTKEKTWDAGHYLYASVRPDLIAQKS